MKDLVRGSPYVESAWSPGLWEMTLWTDRLATHQIYRDGTYSIEEDACDYGNSLGIVVAQARLLVELVVREDCCAVDDGCKGRETRRYKG